MRGSDTDDLLLLKFGDRLCGALGAAVVLDDLLDAVLAVTAADGVVLRILGYGDRERLRARTREGNGSCAADPCAALLSFVDSLLVDAGRPFPLIGRPGQDIPCDDAIREELLRSGASTLQVIDLVAPSGDRLGLLALSWHHHHVPSTAESRRLEIIVRQAAALIEHMLAAAVCSEPARHGLSVARCIIDALMATVERGCRSMRPDGIALLLGDGQQYHYSEGRAVDARAALPVCAQLKALADPVLCSGEVVAVSDMAADERIPGVSCDGPVAAALLAPVGDPGPLAALAVYFFRPRIFASAESSLVQSLADMLGAALQHAGEAGSLREQLEEKSRAAAASREAEARLRQALSAGEVYAWEWNCADDTRSYSDSCAEVLKTPRGRVPATGEAWVERIHPDDRERYLEMRRTLSRVNGRQAITYRYLRADGGMIWLQEECRAELDGRGRLRRIVGLARDVTARQRVEELQRLLMREFDHRARNMLATIQAMISLTARTQTDIPQFVAAVQSRIRSMARAHELIAGSRWTGARVRDVVRDELAPYVEGRPDAASIVGADEMLTPAATMAVAMAVHELTTNAAKYGALSVAEGRIDIGLVRDPDGDLLIEWRESGGPRVSPPTHRGFGSLLIGGSIRAEVGGNAEVRYLPEGLSCTITIPAAHIVSTEDSERGDRVAEPGGETGSDVNGAILVVEDPSGTQFDTPGRLKSFGYRVRIAESIEDAVRLAAQEHLAGAIVDINVGEKDVSPLVDILAARDLPIAFMTGYSLPNLPSQYRGIPVLARPLRRELVRQALSRSSPAPYRGA